MTNEPASGDIIRWIFGIAVFAAGLVNVFWGKDPEFGVFIVLLSFVYFPPVTEVVRERFGWRVPVVLQILLGIAIFIVLVGVGELFDKIDLMKKDLLNKF